MGSEVTVGVGTASVFAMVSEDCGDGLSGDPVRPAPFPHDISNIALANTQIAILLKRDAWEKGISRL
jgi:hypothetical protein